MRKRKKRESFHRRCFKDLSYSQKTWISTSPDRTTTIEPTCLDCSRYVEFSSDALSLLMHIVLVLPWCSSRYRGPSVYRGPTLVFKWV